MSLFAYDVKTQQVTEALRSDGFDFKAASAGPGAIVIEQFGAIKLFDLETRQAKNIAIRVEWRHRRGASALHQGEAGEHQSTSASRPPACARVFEAWGEIFTVPTDKGDIRNITRSPAVADRNPAWSPDGKSIAYFSEPVR